MKLNLLTIVLDGMPWITGHINVLNRLQCPWHWYVIEGAAANKRDTAWMRSQIGRLSYDGTTQYLNGLARHPNVTVIRKELWDGKVEMCNAGTVLMDDGVLLQMDSDEIWTTGQLITMIALFQNDPSLSMLRFFCRFFVGPNIVTATDDAYGNNPGEWLRAWRFKKGMTFDKHEPPTLFGNRGKSLSREETRCHGLVFDHMSYVVEKQVAMKESIYGYVGAAAQWKRLQQNQTWPVKLKNFLPWVDDRATADLLVK